MTKLNCQLSVALCFALTSAVAFARPFEMTVERNATCNEGETTGRLLVNGKEVAKTLELPWRNNEPGISQIPPGNYSAKIRQDGNRGWRIELSDVRDRANVQIHVGNYAREIEGCILVGTSIARHGNSCATAGSKDALAVIATEMQKASDDGISSQPIEISVVVR